MSALDTLISTGPSQTSVTPMASPTLPPTGGGSALDALIGIGKSSVPAPVPVVSTPAPAPTPRSALESLGDTFLGKSDNSFAEKNPALAAATTVVGNHITDAVKSYAKNTWNIYQNTPQAFVDDMKAGADLITKGQQQGGIGGLGNVFKGLGTAAFRGAADAANAIFAPISGAVGTILKKTGGQNIVDNLGNVIADKSGITDWPAFQKYSLSHPQAAEDFNRLLTLVMSKGETSEIDPVKTIKDIKDFANKVVEPPKVLTSEESVAAAREKILSTEPTPKTPEQISVERTASQFPKISVDKGVEDVENIAKNNKVDVIARVQDDGSIHIDKFNSSDTGQGNFKKTIDDIKAYADKNGIRITTTPGGDYGADAERLENTFREKGFSDNPQSDTQVGKLSYEPVKPSENDIVPTKVEKPIVSKASERDAGTKKPVETGGEKVESKSSSIDMIAKNLDAAEHEQFKNDTSHEKADNIEQAKKSWQFVHDNPEATDKIIFGDENPPKGFRTQDIFTARLQKALDDFKNGKGSIEEVLKYQQADELLGSRAGSELGARAKRYDANSPQAWLAKAQESLNNGRKILFKERGKAKSDTIQTETKVARETVSKTRAKLIDYQKIIDTITC